MHRRAAVTGTVDAATRVSVRSASRTLVFVPWADVAVTGAGLAMVTGVALATRKRRAARRQRRSEERQVLADYRARRSAVT